MDNVRGTCTIRKPAVHYGTCYVPKAWLPCALARPSCSTTCWSHTAIAPLDVTDAVHTVRAGCRPPLSPLLAPRAACCFGASSVLASTLAPARLAGVPMLLQRRFTTSRRWRFPLPQWGGTRPSTGVGVSRVSCLGVGCQSRPRRSVGSAMCGPQAPDFWPLEHAERISAATPRAQTPSSIVAWNLRS